jgi:hypothetical protein
VEVERQRKPSLVAKESKLAALSGGEKKKKAWLFERKYRLR